MKICLILVLVGVAGAFARAQGPSKNLQGLVELLKNRVVLGKKVAISKWDSKQPIEDPEREKTVIQNFVGQATAQPQGLNEAWANKFVVDQMEANKDYQKALHATWQKAGNRTSDPNVDLAKDVRPKIDEINTQIVSSLKATLNERKAPACSGQLGVAVAKASKGLDKLAVAPLKRATTHVCSVA